MKPITLVLLTSRAPLAAEKSPPSFKQAADTALSPGGSRGSAE